MLNIKIISTGKADPATLITSEMLDFRLNKPDGYTLKKSGIIHRRFSPVGETQSWLGAKALSSALSNASLKNTDIDLLISACGVQEQALPTTASAIANQANLPAGTPVFDVNASCLSFLTAMQVAASLLNTNSYKRIAIVSSDQASRGLDWSEPEASLIFGDGAAAAIIERGHSKQGIVAFELKTFTQGRDLCEIRAGGTRMNPNTSLSEKDFLFKMNGKQVMKLAMKHMPAFLENLLKQANTDLKTIDVVIPHQASHLGMAHMIKHLDLEEDKVINIYKTHGNQVSASLPTALHEALTTGRFVSGSRALMLGTAAGISIGGLVLDF
ncbi:3-oxoacyl-[acyl-carrier-protein] synthase III C-terminal domain-containing protein [Methylophilus methylotrophus]|uniref:3-oxoacyl-[acyl-carrier-protein] synthase III C-terminal domain-containing protein n=1 Tax=Methylophilus methylotrophus TaxID=17 RepID=UPI000F5B74DE|nr:3-oxoacyl-[acyl-carrier-protein] synthase III C-terminal domain-containing protein [Methylophilus methylotrophus]